MRFFLKKTDVSPAFCRPFSVTQPLGAFRRSAFNHYIFAEQFQGLFDRGIFAVSELAG